MDSDPSHGHLQPNGATRSPALCEMFALVSCIVCGNSEGSGFAVCDKFPFHMDGLVLKIVFHILSII